MGVSKSLSIYILPVPPLRLPTLRLRWVRCLAPSSLPAGGGSSTRAAIGPPMPRHAPAPSGPHPARWGLGNADVWAAPIPTASMGSRRVAARAAAEPTAGPKGHASCATLYPRVHSRAPSRAPTCAEDEVDGEDPGPSQGLDVRTWLRRIVTTGASSQDAFGRC